MKRMLIFVAFLWTISTFAQNLPVLKRIEGGTAVLGGGYHYAVKDYYMVLLGQDVYYDSLNSRQVVIGEVPQENVQERQVTVASFLLSETEVTNLQYRDFLLDSLLEPAAVKAFKAQLKAIHKDSAAAIRKAWHPIMLQAAAAAILPDTGCWTTDFKYAYNEPLVKHYLWHPAFDQYPVVGVSWEQAKAYCEWLTRVTNQQAAAKGDELQPAYRLPTEAEWEFAARAVEVKGETRLYSYNYPWVGTSMLDAKGQFRANIKTGHGDYVGDNYEYTAPVKSFTPNHNGLYHMAGNVSEWCEDVFIFPQGDLDELAPMPRRIRLFEAADATLPTAAQRVVKGGSWADYHYAALSGSRMGWPQTQGGARIGFRVAQTIVGAPGGKEKRKPMAAAPAQWGEESGGKQQRQPKARPE